MINLIAMKPNKYFAWKLKKPEFQTTQQLWVKETKFKYSNQQDQDKFIFYKLGKTFGFLTKRFLGIRKNYIVYYQNEDSTEIKGYCNLQNLYCGFFKSDEKYPNLVYLTNFNNRIQIYFPDLVQLNRFKARISKFTIQLDFENQYQLQDKIGQGSFSKVHLAKKKQNNQQYAVKIVQKFDKNKFPSKQSTINQKRALQRINSQYVSKIFQFYEDQHHYYFILQYLPGKNLMNLIKQNYNFNLEERKQILRGVLNGLIQCHKNGIVHRDIKPQNIIINMKTNKPKLIDLGLCLLLNQNTDIKNFKRCGTMGYIAPEVIINNSNNRKPYDQKCDIFSLGIVAHIVLMGINPLKGKNYEQTFIKNKACKLDLNKMEIQEICGFKSYDFFYDILEIQPQKRLNAKQALNHRFFLSKKKYEGKTTSTQKEMDKLQKNILKNKNSKQQSSSPQILEMSMQQGKSKIKN